LSPVIYRIEFSDEATSIMWTNAPSGVIKGPWSHPLGLYEHTGIGSGIPRDIEPPALFIDADEDTVPDLSPGLGQRWYVSARAKETLERLDDGAFDWRLASTRLLTADGRQVKGPEFYLCDVKRYIDALIEGRSRVTVRGPMRTVSIFGDQNTFNADRIGSHKVFRLMYSPSRIVCTEEFRAAIEQAGLTGVTVARIGISDGGSNQS
jgi:hypothetical protein